MYQPTDEKLAEHAALICDLMRISMQGGLLGMGGKAMTIEQVVEAELRDLVGRDPQEGMTMTLPRPK